MVSDALKRVFDLTLATAALAVAAVPLAVIAVAIRVTMGSPVLFRQERPGRHGRPFTLVKFRTMRGSPDDGPDAERLTRLGRLLRATSLDELPELVNVIRGDMSLVGPRPLLVDYLPLYSAEQARRHEVRPGLTGLAQVSGRNATTWDERLRLDVWYVDHRSLALDLDIVVRTVRQVLAREGVAHPGEATMHRFTGPTTEDHQ